MINNFIGGGQIFLHKIRMLSQVIRGSIMIALISSLVLSLTLHLSSFRKLDIAGLASYYKAYFVKQIDELHSTVHTTYITVSSDSGFYYNSVRPDYILAHSTFAKTHAEFIQILALFGITVLLFMLAVFSIVFLFWSRYGKSVQTDRKISGEQILTAKEVNKILRRQNLSSFIKIGAMPLVKDMETHHMLICGSTGSGKTNLIHNILPFIKNNSKQKEVSGHPAIIIDTTGEMIAHYYDKERGDIILNPCDQRAAIWDFWSDIMGSPSYSFEDYPETLEQFAKILFSFKRKSGSMRSDQFFDDAAEDVFKSIVTVLYKCNCRSLQELHRWAKKIPIDELRQKLQGTSAISALSADAKGMASSVRAVLAQTIKPLGYLSDIDASDDNKKNMFSLKEYFQKLDQGSKAWLFISTPITQREVLMPLVSCYLELSVMNLMQQGADTKRRVWFIIDELASLGNLPGFYNLIKEGRKYGACAIASMQSINQLYHIYGQYIGSSIFGQFATRFFFRTDEPLIAKMISSMCGSSKISKQQKNTSFGANRLRDGQSYTEQEKQEQLVQYHDLTKLADNQCYVLLPNTKARLSKIDVPLAKVVIKSEEYIPKSNIDQICRNQSNMLADNLHEVTTLEDVSKFDESHAKTVTSKKQLREQKRKKHESLELGL